MNDRQYTGTQGDEPVQAGDWKELFPKDHLTAVDFVDPRTGNYRSFNLEISAVVMTPVYDQQERKTVKKPIIRFKKAEKYMFLNTEIGKSLEAITGKKNPKDWVGKVVNAYVFLNRQTPQGKMDVPRLRPPAGSEPAVPHQQSDQAHEQPHLNPLDNDDDIPF